MTSVVYMQPVVMRRKVIKSCLHNVSLLTVNFWNVCWLSLLTQRSHLCVSWILKKKRTFHSKQIQGQFILNHYVAIELQTFTYDGRK